MQSTAKEERFEKACEEISQLIKQLMEKQEKRKEIRDGRLAKPSTQDNR